MRARDGAPVPNVGPYSNTATATTPAPPDATPPSAPGTLAATPASATQIELAWQPATDDVGVTMYRIERCEGAGCSNFAEIALGTSTNHMDVFLDASTTYRYRVRAEDAAQNRGPYSNTATATTPAPPDTTPPSAPGTLAATPASATQVDLSWGAATDDSGTVAQYLIERCSGSPCTFAQVATVGGATTSYSNTGLSPSTAYSYRVRARDGAPVPNVGPYSNVASASTHSSPRPLYFSLEADGTVGGVPSPTRTSSSTTGSATFTCLRRLGRRPGGLRIDAFAWLDSDSLLLSVDADGASSCPE